MERKRFNAIMSELKKEALLAYKIATPYRTGYQKDHIYIKDLPSGGFEVIVNTDYVQFTTDKWVSPQWKGRQNPNEGWDKEAATLFIKKAKVKLGARIRSDK